MSVGHVELRQTSCTLELTEIGCVLLSRSEPKQPLDGELVQEAWAVDDPRPFREQLEIPHLDRWQSSADAARADDAVPNLIRLEEEGMLERLVESEHHRHRRVEPREEAGRHEQGLLTVVLGRHLEALELSSTK